MLLIYYVPLTNIVKQFAQTLQEYQKDSCGFNVIATIFGKNYVDSTWSPVGI